MTKGEIGSLLVRRFGFLQAPGVALMKQLAKRTRELRGENESVDRAANEIFPSEFKPAQYAGPPTIDVLLEAIDKL
jgi:hypothetical protein